MRRVSALFAAVALVAACGESAPPEAAHDHAEPEHHDAAHEDGRAEPGGGLLEIDPAMLRDLRLTTVPVEERASVEGVSVLGELGPNEEAYALVGAPVPARVVRMIAAPADVVGAGAVLAELQSVELGRARAELLAARARLELARRTLARRRALAAERIAPRREVEEAEAAAIGATAELEAAEAGFLAFGVPPEDVDDGSGRFRLRAPLAGTVIARSGVTGEVVEPARPLYRVADLSRVWLVVHAFERDAVRLPLGALARVTFPAVPGRAVTGPVTNVGRQVEAASRTVAVRIEIENEDGLLRPGMSATAVLPVGDQGTRVLAVPDAALQRLAAGWCVFVPRGEGRFEVRPVARGRDLGGEVEIVAGVRAGEPVVVEGAFLLKAEAEKSAGEGHHHDH